METVAKLLNMEPIFFQNQLELRQWLEKNHETEIQLIIGLYKKGTDKENISWSQVVDEVLCFGWIDGVGKKIDDERWQIRITPRKPNSIWSKVNIAKIKVLTEKGLMHPKGMQAFALRKEEKSGIYSFENDEQKLSPEFQKIFLENKIAWKFFQSQPPGYKKNALHYVMTAKQQPTREKRFAELLSDSENKLRIKMFRR